MSCSIETSDLPLLNGCPGDNEYIIVGNAAGGRGSGLFARRLWSEIKSCAGGNKPLIKVATEDGSDDTPIAGSSIYENSSLAGLGASNGGLFEIVLNNVTLWNFGQNPGFEYIDSVNGIIDISLVGTFVTGDGLYVNLNQ